MGSPYDVLGIDPDADQETVVRAYRERVKEAHPDQGGSLAEFTRVRRAYEHIEAGRDPESFRTTDTSEPATGTSARTADGHTTRDVAGDEKASAADATADATGASTAGLGPTVEYLDYEALAERGWSLTDDDLFEKVEAADLDVDSHGLLVVEPRETLLEAAERYGFSWPYACRGGACANCAVAVVEGDLEMPVSTVLNDELTERGVRLSCIGEPVTDDLKIVFNIERLPGLAELRLPAEQFDNARAND